MPAMKKGFRPSPRKPLRSTGPSALKKRKKVVQEKKRIYVKKPALGTTRYKPRLRPFVKEYLKTVRDMQKIVSENVVDIKMSLQEASQSKDYDRLFDVGRQAVPELGRWNIKFDDYIRFQLMSYGHLWVTVRSARFSRGAGEARAAKTLERMKSLQEKMFKAHLKLFKELKKFEKESHDKRMFDQYGEYRRLTGFEQREIKEFKEEYQWNLGKGIISPSFTQSLIYRLEQSLKEHPGD